MSKKVTRSLIILLIIFLLLNLGNFYFTNYLGVEPPFTLGRLLAIFRSKSQIIYQNNPAQVNFQVKVVDTISKQPIEKAKVQLRELVICQASIGSYCPEKIITALTNQEGLALFDLTPFGQNRSFMITASSKNYPENIGEMYPALDNATGVEEYKDLVTLELVGGKIRVKTEDQAKKIASQNQPVKAWISVSQDPYVTTAKLENSKWVLQYLSKTDCTSGFTVKERPCTLDVIVDATTGQVTVK